MLKPGSRADLAEKPLAIDLGRFGQGGGLPRAQLERRRWLMHQLDRHTPVKLLVVPSPDRSHAARPDRRVDSVALGEHPIAFRPSFDHPYCSLSFRRASSNEARSVRLKAAREWLKKSAKEIADRRLAPFANRSQQIWQELRQESNVELGTMTLNGTGTSTRRRLELPVTVDGADNGHALGVMSQGEMHALGLALFLPRSCADESPFRFIVIDDPVQSMDPAKVDGLARVLAGIAESRQVIVFTHDNRLPEAVRRLEVDATVLDVVRAEQSVVTIRPNRDPISRYLDDAWAVASTPRLDPAIGGPVVAEFCRSALEAACHRAIWRKQLARAISHAEIERALESAKRTRAVLALAIFDGAGRERDVEPHLKSLGQWAVDAFNACISGVHGRYVTNLQRLVNEVRELTRALQ